MVRRLAATALVLLAGLGSARAAEETKLYNTGPSVVSGYVRFLNAGGAEVSVKAGDSTLALGVEDAARIGQFQAVPARQDLTATVTAGDKSSTVTVSVQPDEFVTIAVQPDATTLLLRDQPQDFNALKADIGFFNADPACATATMRAGAKKTEVFTGITPGQLARRSVNPIAAVVEASCGETPVAGTIDLGTLAAGGRYSVVVIPDGAGGQRLIGGQDLRAKY